MGTDFIDLRIGFSGEFVQLPGKLFMDFNFKIVKTQLDYMGMCGSYNR
jgi:hypothetical protein